MTKRNETPVDALLTVLAAANAYAKQIVPGLTGVLTFTATDAPLATARRLEAVGGVTKDTAQGYRYTSIESGQGHVRVHAIWSDEAVEAARLAAKPTPIVVPPLAVAEMDAEQAREAVVERVPDGVTTNRAEPVADIQWRGPGRPIEVRRANEEVEF